MLVMKIKIIFLFELLLLFFSAMLANGQPSFAAVAPTAAASHNRMLILYSTNNNLPTLHQLAIGLDSVININKLRSTDLLHEYLDISPPQYPEQRSVLREMLLRKYAGLRFDLIVTYGAAALDFLLKEGRDLSPGSPCLAMFSNEKTYPEQAERIVTHIPMRSATRGTLERALELFPDTRRVLFVSGRTPTDISFEEHARADFSSWQGKLEFEYTSNHSIDELLQQVDHLPPDTIIIFSNVSADITGKTFVPRDVVKMIASKANAPVFSYFSTQIDTGVVGGLMLDMNCVGAMLGRIVARGDPPIVESPSSYIKPIFNWQQIVRWGANTSRLPVDSIFINRPPTIWEQYKVAVVSTIIAFIILIVLVLAFALQNRRRKVAEMSARTSEAQLKKERDLLEQRVAERTNHLTELTNFNQTILNNSPLSMGVYEATGQCVLANEAYADLVGATRQLLLAQNFNTIPAWQETGLLEDCLKALEDNSQYRREIHTRSTFGVDVWVNCLILPIMLNHEQHLLVQFYDQTELKRKEEWLRYMALHDVLTKLPNRRLLLDRLEQALRTSKRENSYLAVLFLDLDKFKQLNDSHGHDTGDQLLIAVANRLQQLVRDVDTVARLGGDEFVVLLEKLGSESKKAKQNAASVAGKIRSALSVEYILGNVHHHSSVSIGMVLCIDDNFDPDEILKNADAAMYKAKKESLGVCCV